MYRCFWVATEDFRQTGDHSRDICGFVFPDESYHFSSHLGTTSGTNQIRFHHQTPQKTGSRAIILHPLHKSTTHNLITEFFKSAQNPGIIAKIVKKRNKNI